MKTHQKIKKLFDAAFYATTIAGLRQSIKIASIPEGIAVAYSFGSMFSSRSGIDNYVGYSIGIVIAVIIYEFMIYRMAINGSRGAAHFFTFGATLIAYSSWYQAFLKNQSGSLLDFGNASTISLYSALFFVTLNGIALALFNDKLCTKLDAMKVQALGEEKEMQEALSTQRKQELKEYLNATFDAPKQRKNRKRKEFETPNFDVSYGT